MDKATLSKIAELLMNIELAFTPIMLEKQTHEQLKVRCATYSRKAKELSDELIKK
jgi:hypothetical protein